MFVRWGYSCYKTKPTEEFDVHYLCFQNIEHVIIDFSYQGDTQYICCVCDYHVSDVVCVDNGDQTLYLRLTTDQCLTLSTSFTNTL